MGLFHKKEKVPEIPPAPNLQDLPDLPDSKLSELPSLPKGLGEKVNRAMVKSAVNDSDPTEEVETGIQELPKDFKFEESLMEPHTENIPIIPETKPEKLGLPPTEVKPVSKNPQENADQIFVRIDKFQNAKKELGEINKNIKTLEALISKMGEIKSKEDTEVSQITESLLKIKTKLSTIDSNVFKRV